MSGETYRLTDLRKNENDVNDGVTAYSVTHLIQ